MNRPRRLILDSNVYIDWLRSGTRRELVLGRDFKRHLSGVVEMELRAGVRSRAASRFVDALFAAHEANNTIEVPSAALLDRAGRVQRKLLDAGIAAAPLANDILIALTARSIGATVVTADRDFEVIRRVERFALLLV